MEHKLTKFQITIWERLQPKIKKNPYEVKFNFDDEFVITQTIGDESFIITVFAKEEILLTLNEKTNSTIFGKKNIDKFMNKLEELIGN
jgi:hypothetical protein